MTSSLVLAVTDVAVDETVKEPDADVDICGSNTSQREASEATTPKAAEDQDIDLPLKPDLELDAPQAPPLLRPPSPIASPTPVPGSLLRARNMLE